MLKAIIVEDEERSIKLLEQFVSEYCPMVHTAGTASGVDEALQLVRKVEPDLVFLDIEMRNESGFDLLEKFDDIPFDVIFTTAYEHYALKAIKFCAIDYILKPIDVGELKAAVDKAVKRNHKQALNRNLEVLMQNRHAPHAHQHQIALSTSEGLIFVHVADILYCGSDGPYTTFHLRSGEKVMTSKNLKEYEELLSGHHFFRVHHSWLINMQEVKKYFRGDGGYVVMSNGAKVDVSKRRKEEFMKQIAGR